MERKQIIIIAGPNGAGKTTFATEILPNEANCPVFVNSDLIAAGLSPSKPERAAIRAARIMSETIEEMVQRGASFSFETTLAARVYARRITQWRGQGYRVTLMFLALPSPEAAIARVAARVSQGGHSVPDDVVRRRFLVGRADFDKIYSRIVDTWGLYDTSGERPNLVDWGTNGERSVHNQAPDPVIRKSYAPLLRAAKKARELAIRTGTELVVVRDGEIVRIPPEELVRQAQDDGNQVPGSITDQIEPADEAE